MIFVPMYPFLFMTFPPMLMCSKYQLLLWLMEIGANIGKSGIPC